MTRNKMRPETRAEMRALDAKWKDVTEDIGITGEAATEETLRRLALMGWPLGGKAPPVEVYSDVFMRVLFEAFAAKHGEVAEPGPIHAPPDVIRQIKEQRGGTDRKE